VLIGVALIALIAQFVRICETERGDFNLHWKLGHRLLIGEYIYLNGTDCPYPPFWAVAHAPLAFFPRHIAQILLFPLFVVSFVMLLRVLDRLTERSMPLHSEQTFWVSVIAVVFSSRFLIRDMPECGVNLALVALCWVAVWLWVQGRDNLSGMSLGLAVALKCTPAAFIAYFLWKRQWAVAKSALVTTAGLFLVPVLFMGIPRYVQTVGFWMETAATGVSQADPSQGVLGEEPLQNDSLRPAMARYLMHFPADHKARIDHPWSNDFLDLPPATAGLVIKLLMLALAFGVAFQFRHPVNDRRDPALLWECAALSMAMLLYSPITWGQHCVGVLPAFYLISRALITRSSTIRETKRRFTDGSHWLMKLNVPKAAWPVLIVYLTLTLVFNREIVGKAGSHVIDSYHLHTWQFLALLLLLVAFARATRTACSGSQSWDAELDGPLLLPLQPQHQTVQAAADAQQGDVIAGNDVAVFDGQRRRHG